MKFLDKSLIEDVQVRFFFFTFPIQIVETEQGNEAPSAPTLSNASILVESTPTPASEHLSNTCLCLSGRSEVLFPAPGAAFLRGESVQELRTCSAAG